jgi:hypothetical protein
MSALGLALASHATSQTWWTSRALELISQAYSWIARPDAMPSYDVASLLRHLYDPSHTQCCRRISKAISGIQFLRRRISHERQQRRTRRRAVFDLSHYPLEDDVTESTALVLWQHNHIGDMVVPSTTKSATHSDDSRFGVRYGGISVVDVAAEPGVLDGCFDLSFVDLYHCCYATEVVKVVDWGAGIDEAVSCRKGRDIGLCVLHLVWRMDV